MARSRQEVASDRMADVYFCPWIGVTAEDSRGSAREPSLHPVRDNPVPSGVGCQARFFLGGRRRWKELMSGSVIVEKVREVSGTALAATGLTLVDVEPANDHGRLVIRVVVDKPGGVLVDDCAELNRYLSDLLDVHDETETPYVLEVSSPGLDRKLKKPSDYEWAVGRRVRVTTRRPISKSNVFIGLLTEFDGDRLKLELDGRELELELADVARARLNIDPFERS